MCMIFQMEEIIHVCADDVSLMIYTIERYVGRVEDSHSKDVVEK